MKTIKQIIKQLPSARRAKIERRADQLIGEEMALQQLREARQRTQRQLARSLRIGQDSVSRIERRSDLLISTLQNYVEAMGGTLKIVVEFKEGTAVLSRLGESRKRIRRMVPTQSAPSRGRPSAKPRKVTSSMIDSVEYDRSAKELRITFKSGRTYAYCDVPLRVYSGLLRAKSKGTYFQENIDDQYLHIPVQQRTLPRRRTRRMG